MAVYQGQYTTPVIGEKYYQKDRALWEQGYKSYSDLMKETMGDVKGMLPEVKAQADYYKPGGGYGAGIRQTGREEIGKGLAQSSVAAVQSGMSSTFASRGLNVLAGSERSKLEKNIEDTRAQLQMKALEPYLNISQTMGALLQGLSGFMSSMPSFAGSTKLGQPSITSMKKVTPNY